MTLDGRTTPTLLATSYLDHQPVHSVRKELTPAEFNFLLQSARERGVERIIGFDRMYLRVKSNLPPLESTGVGEKIGTAEALKDWMLSEPELQQVRQELHLDARYRTPARR